MPLANSLLPIFRTVANARNYCVIDIPTMNPPLVARTAILWDFDRDERLLYALAALHYRAPRICASLRAATETKGRVTAWFDADTPESPELLQQSLFAAAAMVLLPHKDQWTIEAPRLVVCRYGTVDREQLASDDPLLVVPARYQLGLVRQ